MSAPAHVLPEEHQSVPEKRHESGKHPSQAEKRREWKRRQRPLHVCRLRSIANDIWAGTELGGQQRIGALLEHGGTGFDTHGDDYVDDHDSHGGPCWMVPVATVMMVLVALCSSPLATCH